MQPSSVICSKSVNTILYRFILFFVFISLANPLYVCAQQAASSQASDKNSVEKLYFHLDKPYYLEGDTIWFKGYLLNERLHASTLSGIVYLELIKDSTMKVARRIALPVEGGITFGQLALDKKTGPGAYTLRFYTNWMQNFGQQVFFKQKFNILPASAFLYTVSSSFDRQKATLFLRKSGKVADCQPVTINIFAGNKNISKNNRMITRKNGSIAFDLPAYSGSGPVNIELNDEKGSKLLIPVPQNRASDTDLQFMPEGGSMVNGLVSRVAFKAIGEDGKALAVTGRIVDENGTEITGFDSGKNGMGSFYLMPLEGKSYIARLELPSGTAKDYPLPAAKPSGAGMQVRSLQDTLLVKLWSSPQVYGKPVSLTANKGTAQLELAKAVLGIKGTIIKIPRSAFQDGVWALTLVSEIEGPLAERRVFINNGNDIKLSSKTHKAVYGLRDSVAVEITATDKDGKPVQGTFSVAVTEDGMVRQDSSIENIQTIIKLVS